MTTRSTTGIGTDGAALPVRGPRPAPQPTVVPVLRGRADRTVGILVDEGDGLR